jgi:hypothetical protein
VNVQRQATTLQQAGELADRLAVTDSAVRTLADWCGVSKLVLSLARAVDAHRLTLQERSLLDADRGLLYGYRRSSLLYTPHPDRRAVAQVNATVLLCRLTPETQELVLAARIPLGALLVGGTGGRRVTVEVSTVWRPNWPGEPIAIKSTAVLHDHTGTPVAVVDEEIYECAVPQRPRDHALTATGG